MARPRTPTKQLEVQGAFNRNPQRKRDAEPQGGETLMAKHAPKYLSAEARKCWTEIIRKAPPDVLTIADSMMVEITAVLMAQFRADPLEFPATKLSRLEAMLGKFGMTPADRAKMSIGKNTQEKRENPWGDVIGNA